MAKLLLESEARPFITTYSAFSVSNVSAVTNKLITVARVQQMGGRIIGETTSSKLVDADHLVGYQLPSDKLNSYDFYFASNTGCNLPLIFSRKLYSDTTYSGINGGNNPTISLVKSTNTGTTDGRIGRNLWDQLDVSNKMTLTWTNSSVPQVYRSFLLSMPLNGTTSGDPNKYYYLGQVIIICGQIGAKTINLYYKRVGGSYTITWTLTLRNATPRYISDIRVPYTMTKNGVTITTETITQTSLGPGFTVPITKTLTNATTGTYTITIGTITYKIYPGTSNTGTPTNRSISGRVFNVVCPQTQSYTPEFYLT